MSTTCGAVRWGFLGAGFVASRALAPAVHAATGATLGVVGARDPERAAALGPARAVTGYDAVCDADDVDVVYVALPNDAHRPWVERALAAGKHVLCEKPLGLDAAEVVAMQAAAAAADRLLVEATWTRWHPRTNRALALLTGAGGPRQVEATFRFDGVPPGNYRLEQARGGGALLDVGPYVVGAALWALGAEDGRGVTVRQATTRRGPSGVDLTTEAILTAPTGTATIRVSIAEPGRQVLRVQTPGLSLEAGPPAFTAWHAATTLVVDEDGHRRVETFPAVDAYQRMVEAVSARVQGEDAWVLPPSASLAVAKAVEEIAAASR